MLGVYQLTMMIDDSNVREIDWLIDWLIYSFAHLSFFHSFLRSFIHSFFFVHSFIYLFSCSLIYQFIDTFIDWYWLIYWFIRWFIHSFVNSDSLIHSFACSFIRSYILIDSFFPFILSIHSYIHDNGDPLCTVDVALLWNWVVNWWIVLQCVQRRCWLSSVVSPTSGSNVFTSSATLMMSLFSCFASTLLRSVHFPRCCTARCLLTLLDSLFHC